MQKTKILFVCLGNICRSPMAEGVFLNIVEREGKAQEFEIDSAGTAGYHVGALPDSRMRKHAANRGYNLVSRCRQVTKDDFEHFDYIVGMDESNIRNLKQIAQTPENIGKIYRMTDFCQRMSDHEVPDPYYGGASGFEYVIDLLEDSCEGFYKFISK
jgi:protein-tyrosine phosphatase